jgi:signal transduction histidine kinase
VNHIVKAALTLAAHEYKYVADVKTALAIIPHVEANAGEINQVLLNLIVNAAHAIAERGSAQRGTIRVSTASDHTAVTISVEDDGVGVDEGIEDKLYDPFFTTKPIGQGLAIARTIVAAHAGSLSFTSKRGVGTTFFVRLPIAHQMEKAA